MTYKEFLKKHNLTVYGLGKLLGSVQIAYAWKNGRGKPGNKYQVLAKEHGLDLREINWENS